MKKYLIKNLSLIILFILIIGTHYSIYAKGEEIDTDITSDAFLKDFDPDSTSDEAEAIATPMTKAIIEIVNAVVGIIQVIGGILTVISIAIFGLMMLISTHRDLARDLGFLKHNPEKVKAARDYGRQLVIGSVILFSSATLVNLVLNILI